MEGIDSEFWYFSSLYTIITALYLGAVLAKARNGHDRLYWTVGLWALGGPLCFLALSGYSGLILLTSSLSSCYMVLGRQMDMLKMLGKTVLITGCDTGFGHALARRLSVMGVTVFAGVLNEDGVGAEELRRWGSERALGKLQVLQLDVTDAAQIQKAHLDISIQVGDAGLWAVVNNAGVLNYIADGEVLPVRVYKRCMGVNFLAAVEVTQVFLPLLRRSRGRIVNVCSMAADGPTPGFAAYAASKAALYSFSEVLRLELAKWGVSVSIIKPGAFRTNIFSTEEEVFASLSQNVQDDYGEAYISSLQSRFSKMSEKSSNDLCPVLDDMCHALMSVAPRPIYTPGMCAWLIPFLHRVCPTWLYDIIIKRMFHCNSCLPAGLQAGSGFKDLTEDRADTR
ncbi:hypothetical protein UPYG_G00269060 [Umbra pygmaea]|uniref:Ketoreductase domain-containing protein n=1 Tax=Umbra pygmaea TaxID=75934 RepID=A0ABD0WY46_UMBPY